MTIRFELKTEERSRLIDRVSKTDSGFVLVGQYVMAQIDVNVQDHIPFVPGILYSDGIVLYTGPTRVQDIRKLKEIISEIKI